MRLEVVEIALVTEDKIDDSWYWIIVGWMR